jgi:hypothetical protein
MPFDPMGMLFGLASQGAQSIVNAISEAPSFDERTEERRKRIEAENELREKYGTNRPNPYEPVGYAPPDALRPKLSAMDIDPGPGATVQFSSPVRLSSSQLAAASMFPEQGMKRSLS